MKRIILFLMMAITLLGNACQQRSACDEASIYTMHRSDVPECSEVIWREEASESISFIEQLALSVLEITHFLTGGEHSGYSAILKQRQNSMIQTQGRYEMIRRADLLKN